jgi:hypothetical protein
MTNKFSRRNLLKTGLVGITAGIAGCMSSGDSNDDSKTTTEPQPNNDSTPTDTPTPTEETETSYTGNRQPFRLPHPDFLTKQNLVKSIYDGYTTEEVMEAASVAHKDYRRSREQELTDSAWEIMKQSEGAKQSGERRGSAFVTGRSRKSMTGFTLDDVIDWTTDKSGGELITYEKSEQDITTALKEHGHTRVEGENGELPGGWKIYEGDFSLEGMSGTTDSLVGVRGNKAIYLNTLTKEMLGADPYTPQITDLHKAMSVWTQSVNIKEEGSSLETYSEADEEVKMMQEAYLNKLTGDEYDFILAADYKEPVEDEGDALEAYALEHEYVDDEIVITEHQIDQDGKVERRGESEVTSVQEFYEI